MPQIATGMMRLARAAGVALALLASLVSMPEALLAQAPAPEMKLPETPPPDLAPKIAPPAPAPAVEAVPKPVEVKPAETRPAEAKPVEAGKRACILVEARGEADRVGHGLAEDRAGERPRRRGATRQRQLQPRQGQPMGGLRGQAMKERQGNVRDP